MASSDSQIKKNNNVGALKKAELPDEGAQSINTDKDKG